jgi:hypothetical protein
MIKPFGSRICPCKIYDAERKPEWKAGYWMGL